MVEHSEDTGASPLGPAPHPRIVPRPHREVQNEPVPADADALVKLAALARALSPDADGGPVDEAAAGSAAQKSHRFQRSTASQGQPPEAGQEPAAAAPRPRAAPARSAVRGRVRRSTGLAALRRHPFFVWGVVQIFCFGLILLGFALGEIESGSKVRPAAGGPGKGVPARPAAAAAAASIATGAAADGAAERALDTAGLALAKENAGDLWGAGLLLESLTKPAPRLPGTEYQLALLALRRGDRPNAELHLERSVAANEAVAPCCYLRAAFAGAAGDYREASAQLRLAAQAEPFQASYFFYCGEALRRNGQLRQAAECIREALARPVTVKNWELYYFKLRLAEVEAGRGDPFMTELEEKLSEPSPSGDWLLLAAAQNVQRNAFSAAAEFLSRGARLLPPETYRTWVSDYAFQNYAAQPEIARFLQVPPPSAAIVGPSATAATSDATIVPIAPVAPPPVQSSPPPAVAMPPDPMVCSPAEADPALWRTAVPDS
jgi:tetratricopeptide (TPR) repeat protein